jgi:hypothetical protein
MDHSALIFYDRYPVIEKLKKLDDDGKLRLYHAQNLNRDLGTLNKTEEKIYDRLRQMIFAKPQQDLNLTDHGDLVLLINHMKNKRDYFLTMDKEKYSSLLGHRNLDIRFPDDRFLSEVESKLKTETKPKTRIKAGKTAKKARVRAMARKAKKTRKR